MNINYIPVKKMGIPKLMREIIENYTKMQTLLQEISIKPPSCTIGTFSNNGYISSILKQ